jgi:hypothetical protein
VVGVGMISLWFPSLTRALGFCHTTAFVDEPQPTASKIPVPPQVNASGCSNIIASELRFTNYILGVIFIIGEAFLLSYVAIQLMIASYSCSNGNTSIQGL